MQLMSVRGSMTLLAAGVMLAVGCSDETVEPLDLSGPPVAMANAGGDQQSGPVGLELALPLSVRVLDEEGNPPNIRRIWTGPRLRKMSRRSSASMAYSAAD